MSGVNGILVIDGRTYSCPVLALERAMDTLYKYAERTEDGSLQSERLGWFRNYKVAVGFPQNAAGRAEYKLLLNKITEPAEFHNVSVPDTDGMTPVYEAYFAGISDKLIRIDRNGSFWWSALTFDIIARKPFK